jgi:pyruvate formate lyase activating enzyme
MQDIPATPVSTLIQAREIAMDIGLNYVYTGNVHNTDGDSTYCPSCKEAVIERDWYEINNFSLDRYGHCPECGTVIAGQYDDQAGNFGRNRIPIAIHR